MQGEHTEILYGYCHCGCGRKTKIAPRSSSTHGYIKGEPYKWIHGHAGRGRVPAAGERFGRVVVIGEAPRDGRFLAVECRCDCGTVFATRTSRLLAGNATSCGCKARDAHVHGHARRSGRHSLYKIWATMKQRCLNSRSSDFADYGGRGITVCERWRYSFDAFLADMGERPAGATIERIDNDGPYSPDNCRWATRLEQAQNRRPRSGHRDKISG